MKTLIKNKQEQKNTFSCYLPIFWGFYGSSFEDIDFYGESENYNLPENFPFYDYLNYNKYYEALAIKFVDAVQNELSEFIISAKFKDLDSPKYYNFENDKIAISVEINRKKIKRYIYENLESFEQFLIENHKSRDGFYSFYSHTFEDWKKYTNNFTDYSKEGYVCLTSILRFIAEQEQITEECLYEASYEVHFSNYYNEDFYELIKLMEITSQNEFINTDKATKFLSKKYNDIDDIKGLNDTINNIIEVTRNNYLKSDVLATVQEQFNEDTHNVIYEEIINVEAIVEATIKKIEEHNLKLEL